MPRFSIRPRFVVVLAVALVPIACDGNVAAPTRCNADIDCALDEVCRDGVCEEGGIGPGPSPRVDGGPSAPEPEPETPDDGGALDAGLLNDGGIRPPDAGTDDGGVQTQWWDRQFAARRAITISAPATVTETLVDVPVQVRLTRADVPDARDDFGDVRFATVDGAPMAFEREGADADGASFWVRVPEISPATPASAYVYFQNPDAEPLPYNPDVWTNGYAGVWHFAAEPLSEPLQNRADFVRRTAGFNRGADLVEAAEGGLDLDGSNDSVTLDKTTDLAHAADAVTFSARVNTTLERNDLQIVVGISVSGDAPGDRSRASLGIGDDGEIQLYGRRTDGEEYVDQRSEPAVVQANTWHHLSGTLDYVNGTLTAYVDGTLVLDVTQEFSATPPEALAKEIVVGAEDDQLGSHFEGRIDEVRISTLPRSASWRAFESAMLSGDVHTLGDTETLPRVVDGTPPVAVEDVIALQEDGDGATLSLFDNDVADDVERLYLVSVPGSDLGNLTVAPDRKSVTFSPNANANGGEEHTVVISDGRNGRSEASLRIDVESINDLPRARFDRISMRPGETVSFDVRDNDDDVETPRAALDVAIEGATPQGVVVRVGDASGVEIEAAEGAALGEFPITYTITDGDGGTATSRIHLSLHNAPSGLTFADVSGAAGITREGDPDGVSVVDVNQDGLLDIAAIGDDSSRIFHRQSNDSWAFSAYFEGPPGRQFSFANIDGVGPLEGILTRDMTVFRDDGTTYVADESAGTVNDNTGSFVWVDANLDGFIDIFAAGGTSPGLNFQYNDGTGVFTQDITPFPNESSDVETSTSADINEDGLQDFLIMASNIRFYVSQPDGSYVESASEFGLRDETQSDPYAGVTFGDCDNDGDFDLAVGARGTDSPRIYKNEGGEFVRDQAFDFDVETGVGLAWGDVDNDGDLDLFIGGGSDRYAAPRRHHGSLLLLNRGNCTFVDASTSVGLEQTQSPISSAVLADLDKDGDLDLVGNRHANTVGVFENTLDNGNGFRVVVTDTATQPAREVRGAVVQLTAERVSGSPLTLVRQVSGGEGNWSQGPSEVHFGLGSIAVASVTVTVRFPDGRVAQLGPLSLDAATDDGPRSLIVDGGN